MKHTWMIVVNPQAGNGKGLKKWPVIQDYLDKMQVVYDSFFTEYPGHAIGKSSEFIKQGYRKFAVVGGDGSLNEVVNGIFIQKEVPTSEMLLANIPVGNGNDWGKTYSNPVSIEQSVELLIHGKKFRQDIGKLTYFSDGKSKYKYFINIAGFGFDALVVRDVQKAKEKGRSGTFIYFLTLLLDLFKSRNKEAIVILDDHTDKARLLSIAAGICKYNGGGMMILPFSKPDSAYLDITMIGDLSKWGVIKNVLRLFNGSFVKISKVILRCGRHFKLQSDIPFLVEADGEFLGESPAEIELIPASLNVLVNSTNFEVNPKLKKYAPSTI
ncbi:MAG: diacylglycerol kinase family lipid kinase [Bacteroidetes bacterium]|nr:diacylglycerol kinase family lipid kinase [Bacteroidota bacterium]